MASIRLFFSALPPPASAGFASPRKRDNKGFVIPRSTENLEAYDDVLRGQEYQLAFTSDGDTKARQMFEKVHPSKVTGPIQGIKAKVRRQRRRPNLELASKPQAHLHNQFEDPLLPIDPELEQKLVAPDIMTPGQFRDVLCRNTETPPWTNKYFMMLEYIGILGNDKFNSFAAVSKARASC